jgi:hypothetical protein
MQICICHLKNECKGLWDQKIGSNVVTTSYGPACTHYSRPLKQPECLDLSFDETVDAPASEFCVWNVCVWPLAVSHMQGNADLINFDVKQL